MYGLGNLGADRGYLDDARHWYQQAINTGHHDAADDAQRQLTALDRHEKDRQRGEQFGRYGYLAYADPALMNQTDQPPATPHPEPKD